MAWVCGWIGNLRRVRMFIKIQGSTKRRAFDHLRNLHLWIERASGWLVSCLSQFWGWKIPIQVGVWRGHPCLSWRFNGVCICRCKLHGSSWFLIVQHFLSTISNFYCTFLLMEGLRFGWAIVLSGRDYIDPFLIGISLIFSFPHSQRVSGLNIKWLNLKVIINEQTMTISLLDWCMPLNADDLEIIMVHVWL